MILWLAVLASVVACAYILVRQSSRRRASYADIDLPTEHEALRNFLESMLTQPKVVDVLVARKQADRAGLQLTLMSLDAYDFQSLRALSRDMLQSRHVRVVMAAHMERELGVKKSEAVDALYQMASWKPEATA